MKSPKTLRRPENWQDFESLCKKLWGEIWKCPEIKKNGRKGQTQNGVDVYGTPSFDDGYYYGIQCKGKDEYTHKQLTEDEFNEEVEKAKSFEPKLKKLYFATTAVKDAEIEKVVRLKNLEHKQKGLFEVHLFSWEDIVDLIDENRETYNYYVNSISFKSSQSVEVTFHNDKTELEIAPKFRKSITHYNQKAVSRSQENSIVDFIDTFRKPYVEFTHINRFEDKTKINLSLCKLCVRIHNTGDVPIEEFKLLLEFKGEIIELSNKNKILPKFHLLPYIEGLGDTFLDSDSMTGKVIPKKKILVGDDFFQSDDIFIKPKPEESNIQIKWKLISKSFKKEGELSIIVIPDIEVKYKDVLVEDPLKVGIEESDIEDCIVEYDEGTD